ncbi:MAG: 2'-5' RNA ligase family protein [Pseudomonadota bacterium]
MLTIRQQLSMFVPPQSATDLERVRHIVDPIQSNLIPAHITLCREDELTDFSTIRDRLKNLQMPAITLNFGPAQVFYEHGLILHCISGEEVFLQLREYVLGTNEIRKQYPHLTLAHPRNPKDTGNSLALAASLSHPLKISFTDIHLIEQEGSAPWRVLQSFPLSQ